MPPLLLLQAPRRREDFPCLYNLVDKQDRKKLGEGRNSGLAGALSRYDSDTHTLITVQPLSPCKDYMNDVVYSEHSHKPYAAYGLNTKYHGLWTDSSGKEQPYAYMVIGVLKRWPGDGEPGYASYQAEVDWLKDHHQDRVQAFLNWFEERMDKPAQCNGHLTVIRPIAGVENRYSVVLPIHWVRRTYMISLYMLLMRAALEALDKLPLPTAKDTDYLKWFPEAQTTDKYYFKQVEPKVRAIMGGELPVQDWKTMGGVHNHGIVAHTDFPSLVKAKTAPVVKTTLKPITLTT